MNHNSTALSEDSGEIASSVDPIQTAVSEDSDRIANRVNSYQPAPSEESNEIANNVNPIQSAPTEESDKIANSENPNQTAPSEDSDDNQFNVWVVSKPSNQRSVSDSCRLTPSVSARCKFTNPVRPLYKDCI